ncbi:MAG: hypothetical protein R3C14_15265 [Caldilineaceae bacterium]
MNAPVQQKSEGRHKSVPPFYPPPAEPFDTPWQITVYSATHERERWQRYNEIANRSYAVRGLKSVGEERHIDIDQYPTYFAEATVNGSAPIGGVRVHTPSPHGWLPLQEELTGYTDMESLQLLCQELMPEGICHGGGLWINPKRRLRGLAGDLARACFVMFAVTRARWYLGAGHQYVLDTWASLGWHPTAKFPTFPYPDERYESYVLLGNQDTWPKDLRIWTAEQTENVVLNGQSAQFVVQPMRLKK